MKIENDDDAARMKALIEKKLRGEGLTKIERLAQFPHVEIIVLKEYLRSRR